MENLTFSICSSTFAIFICYCHDDDGDDHEDDVVNEEFDS